MLAETADDTQQTARTSERPVPGVVVVFAGTAPQSFVIAAEGGRVEIGRDGRADLPDDRLSRAHCRIEISSRGFIVDDLGSRNGTFVDGARVVGRVTVPTLRVVRAADTVVLPCSDVSRFREVERDSSVVMGARLLAALEAVDRAAATSETVLLAGETGTGKELAARRFHARGPNGQGPFVAVNCATIPEGLAERLLFGAKRGAYSGATEDTLGHIRAADGGVLFLDECAELELDVQAKLLRAIEAREIVPLGATHATRVGVRICAATHVNLRRAVSEGRFRADLYHRLAPPEVVLPALRDRPDEIPHHVADEIATTAPGMKAHAKLIEACLLRAWPGNVRELRRHARAAAATAVSDGADRVRAEHLAPGAGEALGPSSVGEERTSKNVRTYVHRAGSLTRETLERELRERGGNLSEVARSLGMHRTQLRRELVRHGLTPDKTR